VARSSRRDSFAAVSSNMAANGPAEAELERRSQAGKEENRKNWLLWLLLENASSACQATSSQ
jgi:hypothetical protein